MEAFCFTAYEFNFNWQSTINYKLAFEFGGK